MKFRVVSLFQNDMGIKVVSVELLDQPAYGVHSTTIPLQFFVGIEEVKAGDTYNMDITFVSRKKILNPVQYMNLP